MAAAADASCRPAYCGICWPGRPLAQARIDDPHHFGMIAATNAISDIYAMGGKPLFALAILGMPLGKLDPAVAREILAGGAAACRLAGIPVAGGHSIDSAEPIYGLAVTGEVLKAHLKTNAGAQVGDVLILTKPLGVGIYSSAFRKGVLTDADYADMIASTTRLNTVGETLGRQASVHALTDVTGFGLLGHGLEMACASGVGLAIDRDAVPLLPAALALAGQGHVTGASARNWASVADRVELDADCPQIARDLLTDPQTSGGLLVAVPPAAAPDILALIHDEGFAAAAIIGQVHGGEGRVTIQAMGTI
jgi:selenide,water dikinase